MKGKKLLSAFAALAMTVSAFTGLAVTADAATNSIYLRALVADETNGTVAWSAADVSATEWVTSSTTVSTADTTQGLYLKGGNSSWSAAKSITPTDNSIITLEAVWNSGGANGNSGSYTYLQLGNSISFRANSQSQTGSFVVGDTATVMNGFCKNGSNRTDDDWKIKLVVDTAQNKVTTVSVVSSLASNVSYSAENIDMPLGAIYDSISMGFNKGGRTNNNYCSLKSISLTEVKQDIQTANYSIKYVCGENVVKTVSGSGVVGNVPIIDIDMFDVEKQRYICDSNDLEGKTIAADGSTVVTVQCHAAANYEMSVVASTDADKVFASATVVEGDNFAYSYPKYITDENKKVMAVCNNTTYSVTMTPTKSETITVPYTAYVGTAQFVEHEAISGSSADQDSSNYSGGKATRAVNAGTEGLIVQDNGVYTLTVVGACRSTGNSSVFAIYKNAVEEANLLYNDDVKGASQNKPAVKTKEDISLAAGDKIIVQGDNGNTWIDYVLIEKAKTPSIEALPVTSATLVEPLEVTALDETTKTIPTGTTLYTFWVKTVNCTEGAPSISIVDAQGNSFGEAQIIKADLGTEGNANAGYYCVQVSAEGLANGTYTATFKKDGAEKSVDFTIGVNVDIPETEI